MEDGEKNKTAKDSYNKNWEKGLTTNWRPTGA